MWRARVASLSPCPLHRWSRSHPTAVLLRSRHCCRHPALRPCRPPWFVRSSVCRWCVWLQACRECLYTPLACLYACSHEAGDAVDSLGRRLHFSVFSLALSTLDQLLAVSLSSSFSASPAHMFLEPSPTHPTHTHSLSPSPPASTRKLTKPSSNVSGKQNGRPRKARRRRARQARGRRRAGRRR